MDESRDYRNFGGSDRGLYYRNSGKCNVGRLTLGIILGFLILIPTAIIYSAGLRYIPLIYANVFLTIGYAAGCGWLAGILLVWARNRNRAVNVITGLLLGGIGLWLAWGFWMIFLYSDLKLFSLHSVYVMHPQVLLGSMREVMDMDEYLVISSSSISGWGLAVLWVIEAAVVLFGSMALAYRMYGSRAFCETCSDWTRKIFTSRSLIANFDLNQMREKLENHDFSSLTALEEIAGDSNYTLVEVKTCDCGDTYLLTVIDANIVADDKGKETVKRNEFVNNLYITEAEAKAITAQLKPAY